MKPTCQSTCRVGVEYRPRMSVGTNKHPGDMSGSREREREKCELEHVTQVDRAAVVNRHRQWICRVALMPAVAAVPTDAPCRAGRRWLPVTVRSHARTLSNNTGVRNSTQQAATAACHNAEFTSLAAKVRSSSCSAAAPQDRRVPAPNLAGMLDSLVLAIERRAAF